MQDDSVTPKRDAPSPHPPLRPPTEAGRYRAKDVAAETFAGAPSRVRVRQKTMDETVAELDRSRLSQEDLEKIATRGGPAVGDTKALIRRQGERADAPAIDRIQKSLGFGLREIRVSLDSVVTYPFSAEVRLPDSEKPVQLRLQVLRCGPPLFRMFLLSNAPIQVLGYVEGSLGLENRLMNCLTNPRSITLPGEPGDMRYLYLTSPAIDGLLSAMQEKCMETVPPQPAACQAGASYPEADLPAPAQKPADPLQAMFERKSLRPPRKEETGPATAAEAPAPPKEDAKNGLVNTLGIAAGDLEDARKIADNTEELREIFSNPQRKFVFRGWEVMLTRPGVEGTRLLVSPRHPSDLVDGNAAAINYIVPSEYAEKRTKRGQTLYYIRVKQEKTVRYTDSEGRASVFSLERLDDSCQILEVPEEKPAVSAASRLPAPQPAQQAASAPEKAARRPSVPPQIPFAEELQPRRAAVPPTADQVLEEAFELIRRYAADLGGRQTPAPQECVFGNNLAVLVSSGNRTYLVTDAEDWHKAKDAMEKRLSFKDEEVMLTEIQTSYARRKMPLPSGGSVTITVKPVGKSIAHNGLSNTLEMIPPAIVQAAIASAEKRLAGAGSQAPAPAKEEKAPVREPEEERRRTQTIELIRGAVVSLTGGLAEDMMMDVFMDPDIIQSVHPDPGRWYLIATTDSGKSYALFRFPCTPGSLSDDITSMPAAVVFTSAMSPGYSFMLIETKFLAPSLTEILLSDWKKPAAGS